MRQPAKTISSSRLTSRWTSCWTASAVFFRRREGIFYRPQTADLRIDLDEGAAQLAVALKLSDLTFRLALRGQVGKALCDGLAARLKRKARVRCVARVALTVAVAARIAATAAGTSDGTRAEITELTDLLDQVGALAL